MLLLEQIDRRQDARILPRIPGSANQIALYESGSTMMRKVSKLVLVVLT